LVDTGTGVVITYLLRSLRVALTIRASGRAVNVV